MIFPWDVHLSRWENPGGRSYLSRRAPRAFTQVGGHSARAVASFSVDFLPWKEMEKPSINGWFIAGLSINKSMMDGLWWMSKNGSVNGWLLISWFHGKSIHKWMMIGGRPVLGNHQTVSADCFSHFSNGCKKTIQNPPEKSWDTTWTIDGCILVNLAWMPPVLQGISETFEAKAPRVVVIFLELETHGFGHVMATEKQAMTG